MGGSGSDGASESSACSEYCQELHGQLPISDLIEEILVFCGQWKGSIRIRGRVSVLMRVVDQTGDQACVGWCGQPVNIPVYVVEK